MRKPIAVTMIAASLVLVILAAWLLLHPGTPGNGTATIQSAVITPDLASLAIPNPAAAAAQPTQSTIASTSAGAAAVSPAAAQADVKRISPAELQARLNGPNPPLVWELRSIDSYEKQHIAGSKLVKLSEVVEAAQAMDREQAIVTNCD
jgi:hypothetical protein